MIHLLRRPATPRQIQEMLEDHGVAIKVVVDVEEEVMTGGGEYHGDGERVLRRNGSSWENLWGATWYIDGQVVFKSVLNLKPRRGAFQIEVQSEVIRRRMEAVIRRFLESHP